MPNGLDDSVYTDTSSYTDEYTLDDDEYTDDSSYTDDGSYDGRPLSVFSRRGRYPTQGALGAQYGPQRGPSAASFTGRNFAGTKPISTRNNYGLAKPKYVTPHRFPVGLEESQAANYNTNMSFGGQKNQIPDPQQKTVDFYGTPNRQQSVYPTSSAARPGRAALQPYDTNRQIQQYPTTGYSKGLGPAPLGQKQFSRGPAAHGKSRNYLNTYYHALFTGDYSGRGKRGWQEYVKHSTQEINIVRNVQNMIRGQPFTGRQVFLTPSHNSKGITLLLDMDETLIHSEEYKPGGRYDMVIEIRAPNGRIEKIGVFIRPYCMEFLRRMNQKFEVGVFTAAKQPYADKVLEKMDPTQSLITTRLYRQHCSNANGHFIKDFRVIGNRKKEKVILVDNLIYSYAADVQNGVPIKPYLFGKDDCELEYLADKLEMLNAEDDVAMFIEENFRFSKFYNSL
jgi:Dullard-like phosphatase family protein